MSGKSGDYEVGYGRPPKNHQQKAGEPSKGPNGRRGNKPKPGPGLGTSSPPGDRLDELADILIEEALMPLDDKRRKERPKTPLHAFARSMLNQGVAARSAAAQTGYFGAIRWAFGHKAVGAKEWRDLLIARLATVPTDDIWPMKPTLDLPDGKDIVANRYTNEYGVDGPINEQEYGFEQRALGRRDEAAAALDLAFKKVREAETEEERNLHWDEVEQARANYLHFNAMLGRGHRMLPHRLLDWYPDKERYEARQRIIEEYGDEF